MPRAEAADEAGTPQFSREQIFVAQIREELDSYLLSLKRLGSMAPDEAFLTISGITARLSEIRCGLVRSESRRLTQLRAREVDPLMEECERQFRFHSRIQACRAFDWEVTKGQV